MWLLMALMLMSLWRRTTISYKSAITPTKMSQPVAALVLGISTSGAFTIIVEAKTPSAVALAPMRHRARN